MDFIAKSFTGETVEEHTKKLLDALDRVKELYGFQFSEKEIKMIRLAAEYHDKGKCNYGFQKLMHEKRHMKFAKIEDLDKLYAGKQQQVPHGYLSPAFMNINLLLKYFADDEIEAVVNAIINHHDRGYHFDGSEIIEILKNDIFKRIPESKPNKAYFRYKFNETSAIKDEVWIKYAVVKGMLNRLDYWASSGTETPVEIENLINGETLSKVVKKTIEEKYSDGLRKIQIYMKEHKDSNLIAVASTGSGKTEAALMWIDKCKAFYTLPLKVSINAIYERIKEGYGCPQDKITLLHSDALSYLLETENEGDAHNSQTTLNKYYSSKNFAFPLTVCTVDQLFKFVYKYKGCELILATLKYSKIIIDEIQAYSPDIVAKLIYGLKLITEAGGKFAIITATLPPIFTHFMEREGIAFDKAEHFLLGMNRHKIKLRKEDFDFDKIAAEAKEKKVLVICNTVESAKKAYLKLSEYELPYLNMIHSKYILRDRRKLEEKIMKFARDKDARGVWISTQIVEASLDIDFDVLHTHMCTADSLLQRMGRCFRLRQYSGNTPNVIIYDTGEGVPKDIGNNKGVYDRLIYDRSVSYIEKYDEQVFTEEMKPDYIEDVYNTDELKGSHFYNTIRETIDNCKKLVPKVYDRADAERSFRDISSLSVIPQRIYDEENRLGDVDSWIEEIENAPNSEAGIVAQKKLRELATSVAYVASNKLGRLISKRLNIHIINTKYDFNQEILTGQGLMKEIEDFDNFI